MRRPRPPLFRSISRYTLVSHALFLLMVLSVALVGMEMVIDQSNPNQLPISAHEARNAALSGCAMLLPCILACIWPALGHARLYPDATILGVEQWRLTLGCVIGSSPWWIVIPVIFLTAGDWTTALIGGMVMGFLVSFHVLAIGAACAVTVAMEKKLHA